MKTQNSRKLFYLILVLTVIDDTICDYYTSISGLEGLLKTENGFMLALDKHLKEVEKLNENVQSLIDELELQHTQLLENRTLYADNPITGFKTIRRFVVDFQHFQDLTQQIQNLEVYQKKSTISNAPTDEDLKGAAGGLARLQRIYKLDSASIAKGYLKNQKYSNEMSAYYCFVVGYNLYYLQEYAYATEWLLEALNKVNDPTNYVYPHVTAIQILEYLPSAAYQAGNRHLAKAYNHLLLDLDKDNAFGASNVEMFARGMRESRRKRTMDKPVNGSTLQELYAKVCTGELQQSPREKRDLRCRYVTKNLPFYQIGPLKMEELNADPFVAQYYETIYDSEMEQIIKAVKSKIKTSKVGNFHTTRFDNIRISKNSWLNFTEHKFLKNIAQRLQDITGLSLESAEQLQVANYGIGGHYGPHHDFIVKDSREVVDNRLLTALFYINDVEMGGGTGFPTLKLMVPPIKGSLVVWYNLHKSLRGDYRTLHAGCPILKGSKWICNEWFHTAGQELKRPCDLKPDHGASDDYKYLYALR